MGAINFKTDDAFYAYIVIEPDTEYDDYDINEAEELLLDIGYKIFEYTHSVCNKSRIADAIDLSWNDDDLDYYDKLTHRVYSITIDHYRKEKGVMNSYPDKNVIVLSLNYGYYSGMNISYRIIRDKDNIKTLDKIIDKIVDKMNKLLQENTRVMAQYSNGLVSGVSLQEKRK